MYEAQLQPVKLMDLPYAKESIRQWAEIIVSCVPVNFELLTKNISIENKKLSEYLKGEYDLESYEELQLAATLGLLVDHRVMKCYPPTGPYILAIDESLESRKKIFFLSRSIGQGYSCSYELVTNSRIKNKDYKHVVQVSDGEVSICRLPSTYSSQDIKRYWPNCRNQHRINSAEFKEIMELIDEEIDNGLACTWESNVSYLTDDYSNALIHY